MGCHLELRALDSGASDTVGSGGSEDHIDRHLSDRKSRKGGGLGTLKGILQNAQGVSENGIMRNSRVTWDMQKRVDEQGLFSVSRILPPRGE